MLGRIISDDSEPQAQLGEAYRCSGEVDAEEIPLKHRSLLVR